MKILSTKVHGILDYMMGALLIASPWIFGFKSENAGAEAWVPILLGVGMIIYSIMTNYEYGLTDNISMKAHLTLDAIAGAFLAASPWIFGFNDVVYLPHVILGALEIGAALMTETKPSHETATRRYDNRMDHRHAAHG
jgi:hypothetical protein